MLHILCMINKFKHILTWILSKKSTKNKNLINKKCSDFGFYSIVVLKLVKKVPSFGVFFPVPDLSTDQQELL
jgi:hypothetical protein